MEFGLFSNGFARTPPQPRPMKRTSPRSCWPISSAFATAYISEHHGEPVYIGKVDTLPVPELLMCKAAAVTKRIRMGAAVKLIHSHIRSTPRSRPR